jgi:L-lactate dehydrogenase (cytochrome)
MSAKLMNTYPAIEDLRKKGLGRIPKVARAYLEAGTDDEEALQRNRDAYARITFVPRFLKGELNFQLETSLLGQTYSAPFGIAPVGLTGLMWPRAEVFLAQTAKAFNIPYGLSTSATQTPETVGPYVGENGWFQLYTPREKDFAYDLLNRARDTGFKTLVVTIDIPKPSRRQRTTRAGLQMPPKVTPGLIWEGMKHPAWALATIREGLPSLKTVGAYSEKKDMKSVGALVTSRMGGNLDWDYIKVIRDYWQGPMLLKGIMHVEDAAQALDIGMDGIVVSNHGGRQFDAVPPTLEVLPGIVEEIDGRIPVVMDSGIRSGLDIIRALSLGADFVLLGRAFIYGICALGQIGAMHVAQILIEEIKTNMAQLGIERLEELRGLKPADLVS